MRTILSLSMPEKTKKEIMERAKKSGKTVSAYVISIIELEKNLVSEDDLVIMAKNARRDYEKGKTKVLRTLKDLM